MYFHRVIKFLVFTVPRGDFGVFGVLQLHEPLGFSLNPSPTSTIMVRAVRTVKNIKKSWDSDKALKSTYTGFIGKHQLRAYLILCFGYAVIVSWINNAPNFTLLPPKDLNCTKNNEINLPILTYNLSTTSSYENITILKQRQRVPEYSYSREYGPTAITEFKIMCNDVKVKIPYIAYILGLIIGGLVFGYMADYSGRKMILLGSIWTTGVLSLFQLLSDDYTSYIFFIFFVGIFVGSVQVILVPYVIEMFPINSRAIYGLSLSGAVFIFDLALPWLAFLIKNWKILQIVITIPLIGTIVLLWCTEESIFWFTTQKDYISAVLSLTKIATYNGVTFQNLFPEANVFLRGKRSKAIQCDFQPLLRLEDIATLGIKYPDFDMLDLRGSSEKDTTIQRLLNIITGHHYSPTMSAFYPTDYLHSSILTIYLLVLCGLWLVSALTEYSLDTSRLAENLTEHYFLNYFYRQLIEISSFLVAFQLVYKCGRRWPTFCFYLIGEVCLLGSVIGKLESEYSRATLLVIYFTGKFAARGSFLVVLLYTCEIFPTGLRCTTLGICYMFRFIGMALASENIGGLNDWTHRLVYGLLSLVLGALALLLPETKKFPLTRTMVQVEVMPSSISKKFRRRRSVLVKRNIRKDGSRGGGNDGSSIASGSVARSVRFTPSNYDCQSTIHSVYELHEVETGSEVGRVQGILRRSSEQQPLRHPISSYREEYRQRSMAEPYGTLPEQSDEEDVDDDRVRIAQHRLPPVREKISDKDELAIEDRKKSASSTPSPSYSQREVTAQIQSGDVTHGGLAPSSDVITTTNSVAIGGNDHQEYDDKQQIKVYPTDDNQYHANSEEENYFSEHL
ncbi:unnamed protein product [Didymodactylos carnosus]|uniref:Major facilitator superfamily (MFS) profile domain-containing protein n=1 Tax=Didymodactylos carnosus TaxID=1234261 RepID=A0A8S2GNS9_9BILA|nr:unnamed protein product [Didymodactylos carnosus]CAF3539406.1 unnamed protein product [Didymodactylos carnosus]